jgi:hypothetical protein
MVLAFVRVVTRARAQRGNARYRNRSHHPTVRSTQRLHQILSPPDAIGRKRIMTKQRNRLSVDKRFAARAQKPAKSSGQDSSMSSILLPKARTAAITRHAQVKPPCLKRPSACSACMALLFAVSSHDCLAEDSAVDLDLPCRLFCRQIPFPPSVHQELVFFFENVPQSKRMVDKVGVRVCGFINCDSFQAREQVARFNSDELVHADVANVSTITVELILNDAEFFDILATRTVVPFVVQFNSDELPFGLCLAKGWRFRQRQYVSFEVFKVV